MNVDTDLIAQLQQHKDRIRNVCVLAHVDHGKTTISDHLIASNGLIHPKLAGELRYMDSKEEEQARGITMKSSSISLLFVPGAATRPEGPRSVSAEEKLASGVLINLIDSPGHVDFCSEVSTAARLSDGAFVVVDAVEGVCIQTHAVLRQAWEEKVSMTLIINKIDRLILELRLMPLEAYERLVSIVAHVNMIVSSFRSEKFISEADSVLAYEDAKAAGGAAEQEDGGGGPEGEDEAAMEEEGPVEQDGEDLFSPAKGNVAFASAHDGWAFRLSQFAEMYATKMGCKASSLEKALWGEYTLQPKTRRIVRIKASLRGRVNPLFVSLALDPIWKAYTACDPGEDHVAILGRVIQGLGLQGIPERALSTPDARSALRSVLRVWLPLSEAVLGMAKECLPSPPQAAPERVSRLLPSRKDALKGFEETPQLAKALIKVEKAIATCDASEKAPTVVYISKMVAVPASALPRFPGEPGPVDPKEENFLAFGRVFSGIIRQGQAVHVLPSTYNPADPTTSECVPATASALYLMMGRGLERLPYVPAGNILAISGLDHAILKSATVSSTPLCRPIAPLLFQTAAIVRVAVEPAHPGDMPALAEGLRLLHRADPLVQVSVQDNGEHVLAAAGEVHLETCVKDLRERFAKVELIVSAPLVAFRETIVEPQEEEEMVTSNVGGSGGGSGGGTAAKLGSVVEVTTPSGACTIRVRASPLPAAMASILDQNADNLKAAFASNTASGGNEGGQGEGSSRSAAEDLEMLGKRLQNIAIEHPRNSALLQQVLKRVWLVGPKRCGPNFLLASLEGSTGIGTLPSLWDIPLQNVIKLSKQQRDQGRAPSTASLLPAAGSSSAGGDLTTNAQYIQYIHVPVQIGNAEISRRLGLVNIDATSSSAAAAAAVVAEQEAIDLATRLSNLSFVNDTTAPSTARATDSSSPLTETARYVHHSIESGVASGFELATAAGPLCDEPMWGLTFQIEARLNINPAVVQNGNSDSYGVDNTSETKRSSNIEVLQLLEDVYGPFSGQITSTARQAVRRSVLETGPRLAEAAFLCEITTSSEGLSAVYAVLGRRRSRVLREEMREGSDLFTIHAYLPAEASFGFADELRRRSSGAASASLMLSHWERLGIDPFFVPLTDEEREEFGEEGQGVGAPNLAKRLIDAVRKRKGLAVEQKVVEFATKQRTLARKV